MLFKQKNEKSNRVFYFRHFLFLISSSFLCSLPLYRSDPKKVKLIAKRMHWEGNQKMMYLHPLFLDYWYLYLRSLFRIVLHSILFGSKIPKTELPPQNQISFPTHISYWPWWGIWGNKWLLRAASNRQLRSTLRFIFFLKKF